MFDGMASSALVDLTYAALKDATNSFFSSVYWSLWDAFTLHLGYSLDEVVEAAFAAAAAGDAKAQFVVARLIRADRVDLGTLDSLKLPVPRSEMRQTMQLHPEVGGEARSRTCSSYVGAYQLV